jgi:hypothetical protein
MALRARLVDESGARVVGLAAPPAFVALLGLVGLLGVLWFARFDPITGFAPHTDDGLYLYIGQLRR